MWSISHILTIFLIFCACESAHKDRAAKVSSVPTDTVPVDAVDSTQFSVEYITGKFDPSENDRFVKIDPSHADEPGLLLRKAAYEAFLEMHDSARSDGIELRILSATRNFEVQRSIWESKWRGDRLVEDGVNLAKEEPDPVKRALRILKYSSMPGTSRHHWGTDIDLNALSNSYFKSGTGAEVYEWLTEHATAFGFCQPYTEKGPQRRTGYEEERWHWSYMPLAKPLLQRARGVLDDRDISGFECAQTATEIGVVDRYVFGVAPACRAK